MYAESPLERKSIVGWMPGKPNQLPKLTVEEYECYRDAGTPSWPSDEWKLWRRRVPQVEQLTATPADIVGSHICDREAYDAQMRHMLGLD